MSVFFNYKKTSCCYINMLLNSQIPIPSSFKPLMVLNYHFEHRISNSPVTYIRYRFNILISLTFLFLFLSWIIRFLFSTTMAFCERYRKLNENDNCRRKNTWSVCRPVMSCHKLLNRFISHLTEATGKAYERGCGSGTLKTEPFTRRQRCLQRQLYY